MTIFTRYIVYPDGDIQEIPHSLSVNQLVDLNGYPLTLPLKTAKMIVYRVYKISRKEGRGEENTYHYLELVTRDELEAFVKD